MSKKKFLVLAAWIGLTAPLATAEPRTGSNPSLQPPVLEEFQRAAGLSKGPSEAGISDWAKNLGPCNVMRGDIDFNRILDLRDVVLLIDCVFAGSARCGACNVGDTNCDRQYSPPDVVKLILAIYLGELVSC